MKTNRKLSIISVMLAITLILSFVAAVPFGAAIQCCPRAVWTKDARNYMDNYAKNIFRAIGGMLGMPPNDTLVHILWLGLAEDADDYAVAMGIPVVVPVLQNIIVAYLVGMGVPDPPGAAWFLAQGEAASGWPPVPYPTTYLEISENDYCFFTTANITCTNFNVSVIIQDVADMKGCGLKLGYNATLIDAVRVYPTDITDDTTKWLPVDAGGIFHFDAHPTINNTRYYLYQNIIPYQYVWISAWGFTPFTGTGAVFKIEFHRRLAPPRETVTVPENKCLNCFLDLWETEVLNSASDPIVHGALDGRYSYIRPQKVVGFPTAVCSVYPATVYVGDDVTFDGSASDDGGAPPLTYMWDVGSDGTFDIVTANAKSTWHCDAPGSYNVKLTVVNNMLLNDTVDDPQTWDCVEKLGTIQDLYTSHNRFCGQITPYVGEGLAIDPTILDPDMNPGYVDALTPDVNITLFVSVTYNGAPRMHVLVAFEIIYEWKLVDQELGFPDGYLPLNQTIDVRTAETDKDGIATIWFRVPMWCTGLPFGKWLVTATCKVQEVKTQDWIRFDVGYPVWLEKVETFDPVTQLPKDKFSVYDTIGITVYAKNIMFIPKPVLFVCTVYDDCDVPIGLCFIEMIAPPAEEYCHPYHFTHTCTVYIPQWTYVGKGKVYVAAFTDWPRLYGAAYCPEVTTGIFLEWTPP